jgi:hypothetical protein
MNFFKLRRFQTAKVSAESEAIMVFLKIVLNARIALCMIEHQYSVGIFDQGNVKDRQIDQHIRKSSKFASILSSNFSKFLARWLAGI